MSYLFQFHATDIMATSPITIDANKDVKFAITKMIKYNISGLPVVKNGKVVGVIPKSDILNTLAN